MEKGRRDTVLLTVIAIATLLVAIVGATFAFFTARITNNDTASTITIRSSQGGTLRFVGGDTITVENIYPRDDAWVKKPFRVEYTNSNSNYEAKYKLTLAYTNSFGTEQIRYNLSTVAGYCGSDISITDSGSCSSGWVAATAGTKVANETGYLAKVGNTVTREPLGTASTGDVAIFPASGTVGTSGTSTTGVHTYLLTISYPNDATHNQNYTGQENGETNHEKALTAWVEIEEVSNNTL